MTKNKSILKSWLDNKKDKKDWMGEGFGTTLITSQLPWCQCDTHKVPTKGLIDVLQKINQIRNTVNVDWQDGTSLWYCLVSHFCRCNFESLGFLPQIVKYKCFLDALRVGQVFTMERTLHYKKWEHTMSCLDTCKVCVGVFNIPNGFMLPIATGSSWHHSNWPLKP
jgi:hypothetical protein